MGIRVVVSTEDPEVASVAKVHGYEVHDRDPNLAMDDVPVAAVAESVVADLDYAGPVLIAQPTCPFVSKETLGRLINYLATTPTVDGEQIGPKVEAVTLAQKNTHILRDHGRRSEAVNRQDMSDHLAFEVGVRAFAAGVPFDTVPTYEVYVEGREAFDIDTIHDLRAAQTIRRTIEFAVTGNERVGSGHVKRCLDLANELQHHDVWFSDTNDSDDWVSERIVEAGWRVRLPRTHGTALVIIDQLDTTTEQVAGYKANGSKVVTIEDMGEGARDADLVVNALYFRGDHLKPETTYNQEWGPKWADLRPEFVGLPSFKVWDTKRVLVMFGGTDPSGLGEQVVKLLEGSVSTPGRFDVTWVEPHAKVSVAWEMMNHDLLITSAGRTVYEAAAVGIPTIVIAQNARETSHAHLGVGNLYLGVGSVVTDDQIVQTVDRLLQDHVLRQELSDMSRRSVDGKGLQRISWAIEGLLRGM